jgi:catabolite regulation protein CreA
MYSKEILKVFVYAVALVFKANRINIMFSEKKKTLNSLYGTHVF